MKKTVVFILLIGLLIAAGFNLSHSQSEGPKSGSAYVGDTAPTVDLIIKNYERLGPDCKGIMVTGIHKINDTEYKIITNPYVGKGASSSDVLYDLWKLESKEWVMVRPNVSVALHIKVLNY